MVVAGRVGRGWERRCWSFRRTWRRQRDGARPRRSRCFGGHSAHICATRLLARLSHGTARMRTATAHDAARTRARQGHSQACCGGTTARTRRTRITQAGYGITHACAPPARARAGGATSAGRRSTQNGTCGRERASEPSVGDATSAVTQSAARFSRAAAAPPACGASLSSYSRPQ